MGEPTKEVETESLEPTRGMGAPPPVSGEPVSPARRPDGGRGMLRPSSVCASGGSAGGVRTAGDDGDSGEAVSP